MDTDQLKSGDTITVLGLTAQLRFKSASSLSFDLGVSSDSDQLPEVTELPSWLLEGGPVRVVLGWLDIHHPCEGFHRLQLRVGLPDRYVSWESMRGVVLDVLAALHLPADEPYHISLTGLSQQTSMEEPQSGYVSYSGDSGA